MRCFLNQVISKYWCTLTLVCDWPSNVMASSVERVSAEKKSRKLPHRGDPLISCFRPGADPQFDCGVTTTLKNAQQIQAETPPTEKVTWKGNLQELRVLHLLMHATHAGEDEIGIDEHVVLATMGSWQVYDSGYAHPSTFSVHRVEFACYQSAPLFLVPLPSFLWCSR